LNIILETKPSIIRKSRNVAVLNGKETKEQLAALGKIFSLFWLGMPCIETFVPKDTLLMLLKLSSNIKMSFTIKNMRIITITTTVLMSNFKLLDNGF
jgi:hypothetical protein